MVRSVFDWWTFDWHTLVVPSSVSSETLVSTWWRETRAWQHCAGHKPALTHQTLCRPTLHHTPWEVHVQGQIILMTRSIRCAKEICLLRICMDASIIFENIDYSLLLGFFGLRKYGIFNLLPDNYDTLLVKAIRSQSQDTNFLEHSHAEYNKPNLFHASNIHEAFTTPLHYCPSWSQKCFLPVEKSQEKS